ncbi:hypothetical protein BH23GEM6_BH23GEM6_14050 [soil metagenome]
MLYVAEELARLEIQTAGGDPDDVIPHLADRAFHAYRGLWEDLRDDLGWFNNKNSAYAGGWTTKTGGSQQLSYNQLKPHFIQAVVDGLSITDVVANSDDMKRAKQACQTPAGG